MSENQATNPARMDEVYLAMIGATNYPFAPTGHLDVEVIWNENTTFNVCAQVTRYSDSFQTKEFILDIPLSEFEIRLDDDDHSPEDGLIVAALKIKEWAEEWSGFFYSVNIRIRTDIVAGLELNCPVYALTEHALEVYDIASSAIYNGQTLVVVK